MLRRAVGVCAASLIAAGAANAAGNPTNGEAVFNRCAMCHTANKGGGNGLGPNLFGVVGRKAASLPGFPYSPALRKSNIVWTDDMLRKWVRNPSKVVPGTRMVFAGLTRPQDVEDLLAYLKTRK